ncbi:MAG: hydrogenase formation protein HypD [Candidatus Hydromicrobium americanum]|nr:MAG: hydrogenase formation protein HypD [Candidatus Hydromicrobium americanum]
MKELVESLNNNKPDHKINIMEVCGTHTMAISRYGLRQLIPENINLISGPGCPVCVTPISDIDWIIGIARQYDVSIFTFGDLFRVPGTESSLYNEKSKGKDINICYSPADALDFARNNPGKKVIFIAIGFETTIPLTSVIIKRAYQEKINNFYIYNTHKLVPEALELLLLDKEVEIDAFLCPGHVSAIIGSKPYNFIAEDYHIPCVISGFEPMDILESIATIIRQINKGISEVEIQYRRVVREEGNPAALKSIYEVFDKSDSVWRGLGNIPGSGLKLKKKFLKFDAKTYFTVKRFKSREPAGCECGDVLKGIKKPTECRLFSKICKPENPIGPCMVSSEGSCAAYYKYEKIKVQHLKNLNMTLI